MNLQVKLKIQNLYILLLVLGFVRSFIEANIVSTGKIGTILEYSIIIFCFLWYCGSGYKFTRTDIVMVLAIVATQFCGYIYSSFTKFSNSNIYVAAMWMLSLFVFARFPLRIRISEPEKYINIILKFLIIIAVLSAIYAMIFQLNSNIFTFRNGNGFNMSNAYCSVWGHRNHFAAVLLAGIIASYYYSKRINKVIYKLIYVFLGINLLLTFSRTAYVSLFAFVFVYLCCQWKSNKGLFFGTICLGVVVVLLYLFVPSIKSFVDVYMIREKSGLTGRDTLWTMAIELIDTPTVLFGRGFGIDKIVLENDFVASGAGFHNMYLTFLLAGGIGILLIFAKIIFSIYREFKRKFAKEDSHLYSWIMGMIAASLAYSSFEACMPFGISMMSIVQTYMMFTIPLLLLNKHSVMEGERNEARVSDNCA